MIANCALATLWPWKGVARDGPLITVEFCGVRVPLADLLCTMTNGRLFASENTTSLRLL
jgi:hypothetical protein